MILAGAERFRAITISHLRNADGALLVYDITNEQSFIDVDYWIEQIKLASNDDIVIFLLGNKLDLPNRIISHEKGINKAKKLKLNRFVEVSAKTKKNLMDSFKEFYMEIYHRNKKKVIEKKTQNLKVYENLQKQETNSCC